MSKNFDTHTLVEDTDTCFIYVYICICSHPIAKPNEMHKVQIFSIHRRLNTLHIAKY